MSMKGSLLLGVAVALVLVLIFFDSDPVPADVVEPPNPSRLNSELVPVDSLQAIVVTTDAWAENKAQVAAFERDGEGDEWDKVGGDFSARIGRNGFTDTDDGRVDVTPSGTFALSTSFGAGANPGTAIPYRTTGPLDCWFANTSPPDLFNRWVLADATTCVPPNVPLADPTGPLELAIVTAYAPGPDEPPRVPLLLQRYEYSEGQAPLPTTGSVSMRREDLLDLLLWLDPDKRPVVIMGVESWLLGNVDTSTPEWTDLSYGSTGDSVGEVQAALTEAGIDTIVDERYLEQTEQSVRTFQERNGLPVTGVVDVDTASRLGVYP